MAWSLRKSAAAALDAVCGAFGDEILTVLMPLLRERLQSPKWEVRESAILALGAAADVRTGSCFFLICLTLLWKGNDQRAGADVAGTAELAGAAGGDRWAAAAAAGRLGVLDDRTPVLLDGERKDCKHRCFQTSFSRYGSRATICWRARCALLPLCCLRLLAAFRR